MFLTLASPVRDKAGTIVRWFGTNTDIDAQRKAETGLRQAEKLAVVGRLAASIAHEINNPLEAVMNLIFLARLSAVDEETAGYLQVSRGRTFTRLPDRKPGTPVSHKQQSSAMATDMVELLDSVLTLYRGKLARNKIQVKLETTDCPHLVCYSGEIRQLFANLVGNATDAMPNGGTLRLRVRPVTDWRHERTGSESHDFRYRARHVSRGSTTDLRTLFHHQRRNRYRAGAVGFRRHRGQAQRQHARAQSPGIGKKWHDVYRDSSAFRPAGRAAEERRLVEIEP